MLAQSTATRFHQFWPDDISLLDSGASIHPHPRPAPAADMYLLALALHHGGRLVTSDHHLKVLSPVRVASRRRVNTGSQTQSPQGSHPVLHRQARHPTNSRSLLVTHPALGACMGGNPQVVVANGLPARAPGRRGSQP